MKKAFALYRRNRYLKYCGIVFLILMCLTCVAFLKFLDDEKPKKVIVCWGDSLTAPHTKKNISGYFRRLLGYGLSYPEYLQKMLGDGYEIINAGVGGESTLTIMARQGAYPMSFAHDVTIFNDDERKFETFLGNNDVVAFLSTYNGSQVQPLLREKHEASSFINPCVISAVKPGWGG